MVNKPDQPSKFRGKNGVEINDSGGTYNTHSQIKFKTTMFKSSLCDYSDANILANGAINLHGQGADAAAIQANIINNKRVIKNSTSFTDCITEINNT